MGMRITIKIQRRKKESGITRDIRNEDQKCDKAFEIAHYYGFSKYELHRPTKEDFNLAKTLNARHKEDCTLSVPVEQRISLLRHYAEGAFSTSQPAMVYLERDSKEGRISNLEILGSSKSVADAILIQTAYAILEDAGHKNLRVEINSVGDKDSMMRFTREIGVYFKKHASLLSPSCRQALKKDSLCAVGCDHEKCKSTIENAPKSVSYLSELSRNHFKEVLEYLESVDIPYRIEHDVFGEKTYSCHTAFEIVEDIPRPNLADDTEQDPERIVLARGYRYNILSKKIGLRKEIPAVGISILLPKRAVTGIKVKKPRFYLIHMGPEAKQRCLSVIEQLRRSRVRVHHALTRDKLALQLTHAETVQVPYILIIGQKESVEGTVLVRNVNTRSQNTVRMQELAGFLKKLN